MDVPTLASLGGLMIALLALVGGVLYRLGRHSSRFDYLDRQIAEMREENRREMHETREENRRNHQQLLQALAHHSHDPDTGFAIFRIPPGTENPAV